MSGCIRSWSFLGTMTCHSGLLSYDIYPTFDENNHHTSGCVSRLNRRGNSTRHGCLLARQNYRLLELQDTQNGCNDWGRPDERRYYSLFCYTSHVMTLVPQASSVVDRLLHSMASLSTHGSSLASSLTTYSHYV